MNDGLKNLKRSNKLSELIIKYIYIITHSAADTYYIFHTNVNIQSLLIKYILFNACCIF